MTEAFLFNPVDVVLDLDWSQINLEALVRGEILLKTRAHSAWGAAVTAWMYLPLGRSHVWQQLTDYPRWVHYFPDLVRSEVLYPKPWESKSITTTGQQTSLNDSQDVTTPSLVGTKRLYQVASKAFLFFSAQVEIYLSVFETLHRHVQFRFEKGSFVDFSADLKLQDYGNGTLLMYAVQATPTIPVPSLFIQQAIHLDFPANLRKMRQVLCLC